MRISRSPIWPILCAVAATLHAAEPGSGDAMLARVREILRKTPLIDGHNDVPWIYRDKAKDHLDQIDLAGDTTRREKPMQTDIPRLRKGGVGGVFWSVYVPTDLAGPRAVTAVLEQIDLVKRLVERYPETLELALTSSDVRRIHSTGKIASLIGMEGGHAIDDSLGVLRQMYACGARYMTLTHWENTAWADAGTDTPSRGGLSPFGELVVKEMNRLGMLVDLSHVSDATMNDALDISAAPIVFSHSSARALCGHPRNVPDEVLRRLPANGGVVMVNFAPGFVSEKVRDWNAAKDAEEARWASLFPGDEDRKKREMEVWRSTHEAPVATLGQVADHIDHIRSVAGIDHVGLGSDFDGIDHGPVGLEDVSRFPDLLAELLRRGYREEEAAKVAGGNVLRVLGKAEEVAARLTRERPPSDARIDEVQEIGKPK